MNEWTPDDAHAVAEEMAACADELALPTHSIPPNVGDDEAVHAVQASYADAGFECDQETVRAIVAEAR